MKVLILIIVALLCSSKNTTGHIGAVFYDFYNFTMLDLTGFMSKVDYSLTTNIPSTLSLFVYNVGTPTQSSCDYKSIACLRYKGDSTLYAITPASNWDVISTDNNITFVNNITMTFTLPRSNRSIGPQHEFPQLIMKFVCYKKVNSSKVTFQFPNYYILEIHNSTACQYNFSRISDFLATYKYLIAPVIIIIGLILVLAGLRFFKVALFFFGFIISYLLCLLIVPYFFGVNEQFTSSQHLITFIIATVVSIIVGVCCAIFAKVGLALMGASLGAIGFMIVYNTLFHRVTEVVLYVGMGLCAVICGVLGFILFDHIVIISTAVIGSYLFIRGISVFGGGFPNEFVIYQMIKSGIGFTYTFYAYLAAMIVVAVVSFIIQEKFRSENKEEYEKNKNYVGLTDR